MHFPQTVSSRADPSAVSFLTTLPPEIRNRVYEYLFKCEDQVLLHNADAFHEPCQDQRYLEQYEIEIGTDKACRHDFHEGLALLLSCRQVHHEASGILYGSNIFVFSKVFGRHDSTQTWHKDEEYFQFAYPSQWLTKIESQLSRLKKVIINVDAMCIGMKCRDLTRFDFLPLLRLVWDNPECLNVISFGHTGRIPVDYVWLSSGENREDFLRPAVGIDGATALNNLLTALAVNDVLDIRKYRFSRHLLRSVVIDFTLDTPRLDGSNWRISGDVYTTVGGYLSWPFYSLDHGKTVRLGFEENRCRFQGVPNIPFGTLPENVRKRIAELLLPNPDGIMIDLDTHTAHGLDFTLSRIGLLDRTRLAAHVNRQNNFTLKMTSDQVETDFGEFKKLESFLDGSPESREVFFFQKVTRHWQNYNPQTVILEIAPPVVTAISAVRVNIKGLMVILGSDRLHSDSTIRLTLTPPSSTRAPPQVTTISITKLQRQIFLLLSDILRTVEVELSYSLEGTAAKALFEELDPFPDIWMDGYGNILHAVVPGMEAPLDFTYGKLSKQELGVLPYIRAISLDWMYRMWVKEDRDSIGREHICYVWSRLRNACCKDWNWMVAPPGLLKWTPEYDD